MRDNPRWLPGAGLILFSLFGLFIASRAPDDTLYATGLIFFLVGVLGIFYLIRRAFDEAEGKPVRRIDPIPATLLLVAVGSVVFHVVSPWWWAPIASNWHYIDETINLTFWITGIVFVAIVVFMAYCLWRFRHRKGNKAAYEPESTKLELGLTIVTGIGVAAMLAPGLFVWNSFVNVPDEASEVEIVGQQWSWSFRLPGDDGALGTSSPHHVEAGVNPLGINPQDSSGQDDLIMEAVDLHLQVGQPVELLLRSIDVLHSFYVPEFRAKMDLIPGTVTRVWLTPTRTGTFEILCAELCGVGHAHMRGRIVVDEESDYLAWLREQQSFSQLASSGQQQGGTRQTAREKDAVRVGAAESQSNSFGVTKPE